MPCACRLCRKLCWKGTRGNDGQVYPGIVVALHGADIEVKAMECAGTNRYKWPKHQDQIQYEPQNVLCLIPEPKHVTRRHVEISPEIWQLLQNTT